MTAVRLRLFLTCWLVYTLHFATNFVREHYLVLSMVEDHSYRLDPYYGLHADIFMNPPRSSVPGAHHGANPGISMLAALPYFLTKPAIDWVVNRELAARRASGDTTAVYRDNRPVRVEFYRTTRQRGLDVRFGLVAAVTMVLCMAPITAWSVVLMFGVLGAIGLSQRRALWLSLLYAFGTPVFFRTGYLNHNLALGVFEFAAFVLVWNPAGRIAWRPATRYFLAGLLGGLSFLCDYSGAITAAIIGLYAWWRRADEVGWGDGFKDAFRYGLGLIPGTLLLMQYQWASFGNPFLPPQNWMPPVQWSDVGYQGVGGISPLLLKELLFEPRFGLFVTMPLALVSIAALWLARRRRGPLPMREAILCLGFTLVLVLFFGTVQYTRIQWISGIRYLAPAFPFLFLAAVPALLRMPRILAYGLAFLSVVVSWSMAMVRGQGSIAQDVERVFTEGFQLPWLTVLSHMSEQYLPWLSGRPSALPWMAVWAVLIFMVWRVRSPWKPAGLSEVSWH